MGFRPRKGSMVHRPAPAYFGSSDGPIWVEAGVPLIGRGELIELEGTGAEYPGAAVSSRCYVQVAM